MQQNRDNPRVVVCGAGAAGVEISFSLRRRWSSCRLILIASGNGPVLGHLSLEEALQQKHIEIYKNSRVISVNEHNVIL